MMSQIKSINNDKIQFASMINKTLYQTVALGGTFDHLHDGHKDFLLFAKEISKQVIVGVTDQHMTLQKPYSQLIQPTHVRKQAVVNFCGKHSIDAKVITILDPFGPTIEKNSIQAIVCTQNTLAGANKINEVREKLHLKQLPIHVHKLKMDKQGIGVISAERIRAGEIDRKGTVYTSLFTENFELSEDMRNFFSRLHGKIITSPTHAPHEKSLRIVVGDSSLESFITNNWQYDLGFFDGKRQRKVYPSELLESLHIDKKIENLPGFIETEIIITLKQWQTNKQLKHIFVNGEEDLLAVASVLSLPLGSYVYYGQPNVGMVESLVTEDLKESFYKILTTPNS